MTHLPSLEKLKQLDPPSDFKTHIYEKIARKKRRLFNLYSPKWAAGLAMCALLVMAGTFGVHTSETSARELNTFETYSDYMEPQAVAVALLFH